MIAASSADTTLVPEVSQPPSQSDVEEVCLPQQSPFDSVMVLALPSDWLAPSVVRSAWEAKVLEIGKTSAEGENDNVRESWEADEETSGGPTSAAAWRAWFGQWGGVLNLEVSAHAAGAVLEASGHSDAMDSGGGLTLLLAVTFAGGAAACERCVLGLGGGRMMVLMDPLQCTFPRAFTMTREDFDAKLEASWREHFVFEQKISRIDRSLVLCDCTAAVPTGVEECFQPLLALLERWIDDCTLRATTTICAQRRLQDADSSAISHPLELFRRACWHGAFRVVLQVRPSHGDTESFTLALFEHWRTKHGICLDPDTKDLLEFIEVMQEVWSLSRSAEDAMRREAETQAKVAEEALLEEIEKEEGRATQDKKKKEKKRQKERQRKQRDPVVESPATPLAGQLVRATNNGRNGSTTCGTSEDSGSSGVCTNSSDGAERVASPECPTLCKGLPSSCGNNTSREVGSSGPTSGDAGSGDGAERPVCVEVESRHKKSKSKRAKATPPSGTTIESYLIDRSSNHGPRCAGGNGAAPAAAIDGALPVEPPVRREADIEGILEAVRKSQELHHPPPQVVRAAPASQSAKLPRKACETPSRTIAPPPLGSSTHGAAPPRDAARQQRPSVSSADGSSTRSGLASSIASGGLSGASSDSGDASGRINDSIIAMNPGDLVKDAVATGATVSASVAAQDQHREGVQIAFGSFAAPPTVAAAAVMSPPSSLPCQTAGDMKTYPVSWKPSRGAQLPQVVTWGDLMGGMCTTAQPMLQNTSCLSTSGRMSTPGNAADMTPAALEATLLSTAPPFVPAPSVPAPVVATVATPAPAPTEAPLVPGILGVHAAGSALESTANLTREEDESETEEALENWVGAEASDVSPSKSRRSKRGRRRGGVKEIDAQDAGAAYVGYVARAAGCSRARPAEVVTCGDLGLDLFTSYQPVALETPVAARAVGHARYAEHYSSVPPLPPGCAPGFSCSSGGVARLGNCAGVNSEMSPGSIVSTSPSRHGGPSTAVLSFDASPSKMKPDEPNSDVLIEHWLHASGLTPHCSWGFRGADLAAKLQAVAPETYED
jgi:hypothetical protein